MPTLAKFSIDLEMMTAKFNRQASQTRKAINSIGDTSTRVGRIVGNLIPGGGLAGLGIATKQALDFADSVQKLSIQTGASTEFLSEIRFAAEQTGVSFDGFTRSISLMQDNLIEARKGTKAQADAFKELGIDAEQFANLRVDDQVSILAEELSQLDNQAQKVNIARDIFGRSGAEFLQLAENGAQGIADLRSEAAQLGLTLSQDAANQAAAANDALNRLRRSGTGLTQTLAIQLGPTIENVANFLSQSMAPTLDFIGRAFDGLRFIVLKFAQGFVEYIGFVVTQAAKLESVFGGTTLSGFAQELDLLADSLEFTSSRFLDGATGVDQFNSTIAELPNRVSDAQQALSGAGGDGGGLNAELEKVIDSLKTQEERLLESYERRRQIIIDNTAAESALRRDLTQRNIDSVLQEIEVQSSRIDAAVEDFAPKEGETYFDRFFGEDSLNNLFSDFDNIEQNFKQLVASMVTELLTSQLSSALGNLFTPGAGSAGGGLGSLFGGLFGARATGGPVTGNRPYLVGEQGPEVFVPPSNGTVMPNGSGGGVVVNMTVVTQNADSFRRSQGQISTELAREVRRAGRNG